MLTFFSDLLEGWKELRTSQGYSYQVSRGGKRRVVLVEDYGRRGMIDEHWLRTGVWTDEELHKRFRNYAIRPRNRQARRLQPA
jgi:hypothetical protein